MRCRLVGFPGILAAVPHPWVVEPEAERALEREPCKADTGVVAEPPVELVVDIGCTRRCQADTPAVAADNVQEMAAAVAAAQALRLAQDKQDTVEARGPH